jgi:hypothetical protein
VSAIGDIPVWGGWQYYQVWYRNGANFCTNATYNLTNGYEVYWRP